jgi:hypothetical protein
MGRHADKTTAKRSSSFFSGNKNSNTTAKRSSSLFSGSSRSSSRSFGSFGGK